MNDRFMSECPVSAPIRVPVQLGWQIGEEGSVIMPEPLFTPRVWIPYCNLSHASCCFVAIQP